MFIYFKLFDTIIIFNMNSMKTTRLTTTMPAVWRRPQINTACNSTLSCYCLLSSSIAVRIPSLVHRPTNWSSFNGLGNSYHFFKQPINFCYVIKLINQNNDGNSGDNKGKLLLSIQFYQNEKITNSKVLSSPLCAIFYWPTLQNTLIENIVT